MCVTLFGLFFHVFTTARNRRTMIQSKSIISKFTRRSRMIRLTEVYWISKKPHLKRCQILRQIYKLFQKWAILCTIIWWIIIDYIYRIYMWYYYTIQKFVWFYTWYEKKFSKKIDFYQRNNCDTLQWCLSLHCTNYTL